MTAFQPIEWIAAELVHIDLWNRSSGYLAELTCGDLDHFTVGSLACLNVAESDDDFPFAGFLCLQLVYTAVDSIFIQT